MASKDQNKDQAGQASDELLDENEAGISQAERDRRQQARRDAAQRDQQGG
jgi:hypothetical protein